MLAKEGRRKKGGFLTKAKTYTSCFGMSQSFHSSLFWEMQKVPTAGVVLSHGVKLCGAISWWEGDR